MASLFVRPIIVLYLSSAEIPVVTPSPLRSTEAVNCVSISLLTPSIRESFKFEAISDEIGAHTKPLACVIIKLICSGVKFLDEITKSPSFSLSSSSIKIIISPFLN